MSARAGRARRASRFVLGFLLVLTVVWLLVSFWYSRVYNAPFSVVARQVPAGLFDSLVCAVTGCPAELPEGMAQRVFDEILITGPPVAIHVDEMDRVWVAESDRVYGGAEDNRARAFWLEDDLASHSVEDRHAYIQKWLAAGSFEDPDHFTARADKIVRLEDTDADGVADRRTELATFNDVLDGIGAGIIVRGDDIWYLNIPNIWRLHAPEDRSEAAAAEKLHTGFGVKTSLMGHDMHGLVWGPDGLLYFSVGDRGYNVTTHEGRRLESSLGPGRGAVFRMNPDGSQLEVFAEGLRNPQELAFDEFGNLFTVDNNGDGGDRARIVYVVEGGDSGWAMPYQSLIGDYVLGPWNAERLWETRHPGQPAWILPPIDYLGAGPSGLLHYPGLGLPDSYQGYFFVCDYAYQIARSGVRAFKLEPRGAGFEMLDSRDFIASVIATDLSFGFDGRIYVARYSQIGETQSIMVASHDEARGDPRVAEAARLAREGMKDREPGALGELLGHADQRIRQRAQFELAERGEVEVLAAAAADSKAPLIARIHGIWGLTQLGATALEQAGWKDLAWADGNDELRAQAAKAAGETAAGWLLDELIDLLADPSARVRFFAAQSLGKMGATRAVQPLVALLRENADEDVFLRHGAVFALHRIGDLDAMWALRADPSQAVRLGALLVLRRAADPRVADFLIDPEPALRVEAARAIYDVPIRAALPALAAQAGTQHGFRADDRQTSQAFHRRVIGAALAVGSQAAAVALAAHAADVDNPASMRRMALESLGHFTAPQPRDLAMGWYRPLAQRSTEVVYAALDEYGLALVRDDDLGDRALEVASAYGRIPLEDSELLGLIRDDRATASRRVAALHALESRPGARAAAREAAGTALDSNAPLLRAEARDVLIRLQPSRAFAAIEAIDDRSSLIERQRAFASLARLGTPAADARLAVALERLRASTLPTAVQLELIEAVESRDDPALRARLDAWRASRGTDPITRYSWALDGGDTARGELVFQGSGDCQRCHGTAGHGAGIGPALAGVAARRGTLHLLSSMLVPQAEIAEGFATISLTRRDGSVVTGTLVEQRERELLLRVTTGELVKIALADIASRTEPTSSMPPVGLALADRDLRDVIAYLETL